MKTNCNLPTFRRLLAVLAVSGIAALTGCGVPRCDVEVSVSQNFQKHYLICPAIEVDVIGADENTANRLEHCDVNDYFKPGNALRADVSHVTLGFSEGNVKPKRLSSGHPVWEAFHLERAQRLFLMVNMPSDAVLSGKTAAPDGRRISVPAPTGIFKRDTLYFEITPSGVNWLSEAPDKTSEAEVITGEKEEKK